MRISNGQVEKLLELQLKGPRRASPANGPAQAPGQDRVSLSRRATDISRAKELAANTPEVRQDKVAAIRERIARGEYEASAEQLADAIMAEAKLGLILRKL
jgi:negative regulator of flagellin synthesis FlgM